MPKQGGRYVIRNGKSERVHCTKPAPSPKPRAEEKPKPAKAANKSAEEKAK